MTSVTDPDGMDIFNVYLDLRNHSLPVLPESLRSIASAILPVHPRLVHALNRRVWFRTRNGARIAESLARIEAEMNGTAPGAQEILRHSFQIFLIDLCREALENGLSITSGKAVAFPAWLERLRQRIEREFAEPFGLESLARDAGVSVAYLCRMFKAYTGRTVVEYLVERRVQAAAWKLRESDDKVVSVALGCGFNDLAYFNRTFKRILGMTPGDYRRRMRSASN